MFKPTDILQTIRDACWAEDITPWDCCGPTHQIPEGIIFEVVHVNAEGGISTWCPTLQKFFSWVPTLAFKKISK